jgi:uncharacterized Zn-binding protein involved in type VI secretion
MSELVAVKGDPESHGGGALHADNTGGKMFAGGIEVVVVGSSADTDNLFHPNPAAATGSGKLWVNGNMIHRNNDSRTCGASTIATGQTKLYVN